MSFIVKTCYLIVVLHATGTANSGLTNNSQLLSIIIITIIKQGGNQQQRDVEFVSTYVLENKRTNYNLYCTIW